MSPKRVRSLEPYLLLAPSLIYLIVFFAVPMVRAFSLAFRAEESTWTMEYFQRMVNDANFWPALRTTLILVVTIIPLQFILALVMALIVTAGLRGSGLLIYFYALPIAVSDLAAGIVWFSIFTERGYLNTFLQSLGLIEKPFIYLQYGSPWAILAVILAEVWRATSIIFVILVAGLQGIPKEYNEAAEVFGATYLKRLWVVTLPMLKPSIQVALILRTILAFQVFAVVLALTGDGVKVLASEAYAWYARWRNLNISAAFAALILVISLTTTVIYLRSLRSQEVTLG
ncbi:MAG: ABC transporter permease [Chloroflexi bacterium RBG_19FT_COMBO_56_12]|nr:MAG: ABC transporter permease [Chloroflexi bacterium RBG_19FT_COMBO_56_12]